MRPGKRGAYYAFGLRLLRRAEAAPHNQPMETKWLEDFVSLAETRSFRPVGAAVPRYATVFSRRIQALEAWAGTDLVDRSLYPTRLTAAGKTLYDQALEMLQALHNTRTTLRAHGSSSQDMIEFAVPQPRWPSLSSRAVSGLRTQFGPFKSRLIALNVHDAVMRLVEGSCDLLITYQHAAQPLPLDAQRYDMVMLGQEVGPLHQARCTGQTTACVARPGWSALALSGLCTGGLFG